MATSKDLRIGAEVKTALVGGGSLGISAWIDSWDVIAESGVIESILTYGEVGGGAAAAAAITHAWWKRTDTAERRRRWHAQGWARSADFRRALGAGRIPGGGGLYRGRFWSSLFRNDWDDFDWLPRGGVRRLGRQVRPRLRNRADRGEYKPKPTDYGQYLGRCATGNRLVRGRGVYASYERLLLLVAPPGKGKTAMLIHPVLDAPGALVAASTKPDLYRLTQELRAEKGPVYLFNPQQIGGIESTLNVDLLIGCERFQVAVDRATALVHGTKMITAMQEASWGEKCIELLSKYLMAARLNGDDLHKVAAWLSNDKSHEPVQILRSHAGKVPAGWADALKAEQDSKADRMKASIWSLARGAVAFMSNPVIAAACVPGADQFDVREFIRNNGTLYLLGDDRDETIAPLLAALTSYIYEEVKAAAVETGVKERLDPPFGFILDEVTQITPVPLVKWAQVARAFGIYITAAVQTFGQIKDRWHESGLDSIMTLFSKVILGGIETQSDLEKLSKLVGPRYVARKTFSKSRSKTGTSSSVSETPQNEMIITTNEITMLPEDHALVIMGNTGRVIVKFEKGQIRAERELRALRNHKAKRYDDFDDDLHANSGHTTPDLGNVVVLSGHRDAA